MKFILLYGAPATGKLTIAKELQKLTDFKLLHNHLVVDLIESVDSKRTPEFYALYEKLLTEVINFAINKDVDLINTFVYGHGIDDDFMNFLKNTVESSDGDFYAIQLIADDDELKKRVVEPSRKKFNKVLSPEKLAEILGKFDLRTPFAKTDLTIDNSNKSADAVAKKILEFIKKD